MGSRGALRENPRMQDILASFALALRLIAGGDSELWSIVALSLEVSLASAVLACALGLPLGALVAVGEFPGRRTVTVALNALLGLPSVVVGLVVYLLLSRAGPLGALGILFTPTAIVVAQTVLVLPIVAALARQFIEDAWRGYREQLTSLGVSRLRAIPTLLWDLRFSLLTVVLAGFGRAASEVGAVMIVGGNIDGVTRVMTTAIALETSKGDLPLALALGLILMAVVLALNAAAYAIREWSVKRHG
jgi:tungstate transport system permease protein